MVYYVVKSVVVVVLVFYNMRCFYLFFRERDVIKFDDILGRLFNFFVFIKVFYCVMIMCFIKKKKKYSRVDMKINIDILFFIIVGFLKRFCVIF